MGDIHTFGQTLLASIQAIGYLQVAIIIIIDIILFRVHPVLGLLATLATFAYFMNWI